MTDKPRRLGRGLEALIGSAAAKAPQPPNALRTIAIGRIVPNPFQPRREFNAEELSELEASLRTNGLLQPISVRSAGQGFQLIAGERRLRAATRIGWVEIPALVSEIDDRAMLTLALVENLQRADLDPIDEADGYQRLISEFALTQQQVATAVGKDRSTVANILRLLGLPLPIRGMLQNGQLTLGHARALLAFPNERSMLAAAQDVIARKLTVRDVERLARESSTTRQAAPVATSAANGRGASMTGSTTSNSAEAKHITDMLRRYLQTDVTLIVDAKEQGELRIRFYSNDDLQRLLERITGRTDLDA